MPPASEKIRIGQSALQPKTRTALLQGGFFPAFGLAAGSVRHRVPLVKDDDTIETFCVPCRDFAADRLLTEPVDDLLDTRALSLALVGAQRRERDEQDPFIELDWLALTEARQRRDQQLLQRLEPVIATSRPPGASRAKAEAR